MVDLEHPCARGLTPECFTKYPAWAKRAFAYRLMHTLFPGRITRRLPRVLWEPLIGEGAETPPGVVLPPGTVVPPWSSWDPQWTPWFFLDFDWWVDPTDLFPPDWETGDPLPPGVDVDPGYVFPPGWTPDLPLPDGVAVDPGVTFPPGWTPALPLPPGVTIDPIQVLPPGWSPRVGWPRPIMLRPNLPPEAVGSGPAPPAYTQIWGPGPVHRVYEAGGVVLVETTVIANYAWNCENWKDNFFEAHGDIESAYAYSGGVGLGVLWFDPGDYTIERRLIRWPLTGVPTGSTIVTATIRVRTWPENSINIAVQKAPSATMDAKSDFSAGAGTPTSPVAILNTWSEWELTADQIAYIEANIGGQCMFIFREYDYDIGNVDDSGVGYIAAYHREYDYYVTTLRPQLVITYEE